MYDSHIGPGNFYSLMDRVKGLIHDGTDSADEIVADADRLYAEDRLSSSQYDKIMRMLEDFI